MVQYPQQISQQPINQAPQPIPSQAPQQAPVPAAPEQYQPSPPQPEAEQWYNGVQYQPPVDVPNIGGLPTYGSGVYDLWPKPEYVEDTSMQLPSTRIETL
jgi:metal regulatory transcription factor 1